MVAAAKDYPASPATGDAIEGLEEARAVDGVTVFCGVDDDHGRLVTAGGRVLMITGMGPSIGAARGSAYRALDRITWPGMHARRDIAEQAARD